MSGEYEWALERSPDNELETVIAAVVFGCLDENPKEVLVEEPVSDAASNDGEDEAGESLRLYGFDIVGPENRFTRHQSSLLVTTRHYSQNLV